MVNFINLYHMKKIIIIILIVLTQNIFSQTYIPTKENLEARKWFQEARFGLFIHWGLYALPARHEWVKQREEISGDRYDRYLKYFDPDLYDPEVWADAAANAGMKYF